MKLRGVRALDLGLGLAAGAFAATLIAGLAGGFDRLHEPAAASPAQPSRIVATVPGQTADKGHPPAAPAVPAPVTSAAAATSGDAATGTTSPAPQATAASGVAMKTVPAVVRTPARPRLAIVIDDIGWDRAAGERTIALPGPLTLAVLPGTPAGVALAREAHGAGHEVILHQPMAAVGSENLGPDALAADASAADIARIVDANLAALPFSVGLSNHMGSLLTTRKDAMEALMGAVHARHLYFLDSRTTAATVALRTALANRVPAVRRDVFLDTDPEGAAVAAALEEAVELAERRGHAVAIGHPHSATLEVLERQLGKISQRVQLVPVSALLPPPAGDMALQSAGS